MADILRFEGTFGECIGEVYGFAGGGIEDIYGLDVCPEIGIGIGSGEEPKITSVIFHNVVDIVVGEAIVFPGIIGESISVIAAEPGARGDPYKATRILAEVVGFHMREAIFYAQVAGVEKIMLPGSYMPSAE